MNKATGVADSESVDVQQASTKNWLEDELHPACAKDYLLLCNEQLRQDKVTNQLGAMVRELIKVNLERETQHLGLAAPIAHQDYFLGPDQRRDGRTSELQSLVYD